MEINIKTIPQKEIRNNDVGDYWYDKHNVLQIRVADLGDTRMESLIAIHEIAEELMSKYNGVTEQEITDFDAYHQKRIEQGLIDENKEAGFEVNAPYRKYHETATAIEMIICSVLGIAWKDYEQKINSLYE